MTFALYIHTMHLHDHIKYYYFYCFYCCYHYYYY